MSIKELGPPIGQYKGRDIPGYIVSDRDGYMAFNRVAIQKPEGCVELSQLASDECVIAPGLIYKMGKTQ